MTREGRDDITRNIAGQVNVFQPVYIFQLLNVKMKDMQGVLGSMRFLL